MKNRIDIGTCYRDCSVYWNQWRVDRVFADIMGMPHAVLTNLADPTVTRTLSCQILNDPRRYARIGEAAAGQAVAPIPLASAGSLLGGVAAAA